MNYLIVNFSTGSLKIYSLWILINAWHKVLNSESIEDDKICSKYLYFCLDS